MAEFTRPQTATESSTPPRTSKEFGGENAAVSKPHSELPVHRRTLLELIANLAGLFTPLVAIAAAGTAVWIALHGAGLDQPAKAQVSASDVPSEINPKVPVVAPPDTKTDPLTEPQKLPLEVQELPKTINDLAGDVKLLKTALGVNIPTGGKTTTIRVALESRLTELLNELSKGITKDEFTQNTKRYEDLAKQLVGPDSEVAKLKTEVNMLKAEVTTTKTAATTAGETLKNIEKQLLGKDPPIGIVLADKIAGEVKITLENTFVNRLEEFQKRLIQLETWLKAVHGSLQQQKTTEHVAVVVCHSKTLSRVVFIKVLEPLKSMPLPQKYEWGIFRAHAGMIDKTPVKAFGEMDFSLEKTLRSPPDTAPLLFKFWKPDSLFQSSAEHPSSDSIVQRCILLVQADEDAPLPDDWNRRVIVDVILVQQYPKANLENWGKWDEFCTAHKGEAVLVRVDLAKQAPDLMPASMTKIRQRLLRLLQPRVSVPAAPEG